MLHVTHDKSHGIGMPKVPSEGVHTEIRLIIHILFLIASICLFLYSIYRCNRINTATKRLESAERDLISKSF
jgi:hypothetical protein